MFKSFLRSAYVDVVVFPTRKITDRMLVSRCQHHAYRRHETLLFHSCLPASPMNDILNSLRWKHPIIVHVPVISSNRQCPRTTRMMTMTENEHHRWKCHRLHFGQKLPSSFRYHQAVILIVPSRTRCSVSNHVDHRLTMLPSTGRPPGRWAHPNDELTVRRRRPKKVVMFARPDYNVLVSNILVPIHNFHPRRGTDTLIVAASCWSQKLLM
mmetsp:Transcript_39679/g.95774  ORF Transcript_39679/g.95774 Transcript_39679/m.95774 type:complete len:211 (+) Transcript_39679:401-1033(+)